LIIEYFNINNLYRERGTDTFQIVLNERDDSIIFNYRGATAAPGSSTFVGIENSTGTTALRYRGLSSTKSNSELSVKFYRGASGPVEPDQDKDGYTVAQGDCNDYDASIHPGATEICDGKDNDCNGSVDEGCAITEPDQDGDGITVADGDCNDNDASIYPGADEICGDGIDNNCNGEIDEECNITAPLKFYFPLLSVAAEKTYFAIINNSNTDLVGSLIAYDRTGELLEEYDKVELLPLGRNEFLMSEIFPNYSADAAYVVFNAESGNAAQGYCRFVDDTGVRAATYPASFAQVGSNELDVPYLLYGSGWRTEIAMVSVSKKKMTVKIQLNNGASIEPPPIAPGGQLQVVIDDDLEVTYNKKAYRLGDIPQKAEAAGIKISSIFFNGNNDLAVGAVLYHNTESLSSATLQIAGDGRLEVPHVTVADPWWTGLAIYNPGRELRTAVLEDSCSLAVTGFTKSGQKLSEGDVSEDISLGVDKITVASAKDLPDGTVALKIAGECDLSGVEFIGTEKGAGCVLLSGKRCKNGVFARVQAATSHKWSGIALLNSDPLNEANVALVAYDNDGQKLAEEKFLIGAASQLVGVAETLFTDDISSATMIRFFSDKELSGLIINNVDSEVDGVDGSQIDILPVLKIESTGSLY